MAVRVRGRRCSEAWPWWSLRCIPSRSDLCGFSVPSSVAAANAPSTRTLAHGHRARRRPSPAGRVSVRREGQTPAARSNLGWTPHHEADRGWARVPHGLPSAPREDPARIRLGIPSRKRQVRFLRRCLACPDGAWGVPSTADSRGTCHARPFATGRREGVAAAHTGVSRETPRSGATRRARLARIRWGRYATTRGATAPVGSEVPSSGVHRDMTTDRPGKAPRAGHLPDTCPCRLGAAARAPSRSPTAV